MCQCKPSYCLGFGATWRQQRSREATARVRSNGRVTPKMPLDMGDTAGFCSSKSLRFGAFFIWMTLENVWDFRALKLEISSWNVTTQWPRSGSKDLGALKPPKSGAWRGLGGHQIKKQHPGAVRMRIWWYSGIVATKTWHRLFDLNKSPG